jgi:hypothetical protein
MAQSRLGHAAEARKELKQALEQAGRASREPPLWVNLTLPELVVFELLRREAEDLIDPKPPEKPAKKRD